MKILDIGCGNNKYKSLNKGDKVIGLDSIKLQGIDVIHNLEKFPWPFKNEEFDLIICNNILEHLSDLIRTMEELWKILKKGGKIKIDVPYFSYYGAFQDPTHKRFFTYKTFEYFTEKFAFGYYSKKKFKIIKRKLVFSVHHPILNFFEPFINKFPRFYERFFCYLLPVEKLEIELQK